MPVAMPSSAPLEHTRPNELGVTNPVEIVQLLRTVLARGVPVTLLGSDGTVYGSTLWTLDVAQRRMAFTADVLSPAVHRLVETEDVTAVCYLDQVKLEFDLTHRLLVHGAHSCVLQAQLPTVIYRFQRRSSYRVRTLERVAPTVTLRHPGMPDVLLDLRVLDLSAGGCALYMPHDVPPIDPGVTLNGVRVQLDQDTVFTCALLVHHLTSIQPQAQGVRLGCELLYLDADQQRTLQRYIDQTQKRRRQLALD
ncbi:MAG: flagellar brake protein [Proteobacteria bacterium]|nr:flagellar brake protein [Pseudomonadota bacterium]